jgi:non-ribosomal peptide synthetase component E (peptide arylation enzyme)
MAAESPAATALIFGGERISYADLAGRTEAMAAALAERGVRQGHRCGILLEASPDFIVVQQALFCWGRRSRRSTSCTARTRSAMRPQVAGLIISSHRPAGPSPLRDDVGCP